MVFFQLTLYICIRPFTRKQNCMYESYGSAKLKTKRLFGVVVLHIKSCLATRA